MQFHLLKVSQEYVQDEPFLMTYGDGVCDVDINKLIQFHKQQGKIATLTAVKQMQEKGVCSKTHVSSDR